MDILDRNSERLGQEEAEAGRVQHAGHADHLLMGQAREFPQRPDHRVERIGDAYHEGVRRMGLDALAHGLHHLEVDAQQIVAAHARLSGHAGGDDAYVRAGQVGVVAGPLEQGVGAEHRRGLVQVEGLALWDAFDDIDEDYVGQFLGRDPVGGGCAHVAGAYDAYFFTHGL